MVSQVGFRLRGYQWNLAQLDCFSGDKAPRDGLVLDGNHHLFALFCARALDAFGIHRLLYHVPVYNLFRSSFWHLYEFNLAVAALAGIGCTRLAQMEGGNNKRVLIKSLGLTSALVVITATLYCFFPHRLGAEIPPPTGASSLSNPEAFIPILMFVLSVASICYYARRRDRFAGALLFVVVMLDLASCGWFSHWRTMKYEELARLSDPPVVKAIRNARQISILFV